MIPKRIMPISSLLIASTAGFIAGQSGPANARVPRGIYAVVQLGSAVNAAQNAAYPGTPPAYPDPATDSVLVSYFTTLLDNPAVSGLFVGAGWSLLNPGNPGSDASHPVAGAYIWNPVDDLFTAVGQWNAAHASLPPKTIQISLIPGFASPAWVLSDIDNGVCGAGKNCTGLGSCDGLFMTPQPAVSAQCGYTTLFYRTEAVPIEQLPLPLPWNSIYKNDWKTFLVAFNQHLQGEPSSSAFVSIDLAGPTASSSEMILPSSQGEVISPYPPTNTDPNSTNVVKGDPMLTLLTPGVVPAGETATTVDVPTAWNALFKNYYGLNAAYQNSDQPFIDEWNAVIDAYGQIFSGVTLVLTTTTDALPSFPAAADASLFTPATGFGSDCADATTGPLSAPGDAMACATVTQVLAHFTNPLAGGNNAKATSEAGMTAGRDGQDLGTNAVKWLATTTSSGAATLPGLSNPVSRIVGGVQFSHSFSSSKVNGNGSTDGMSDLQAEGCPGFIHALCNGPDGTPSSFSPGEGLANVLSISYFPGTAVGPSFCAYTDPSVYGCAPTSIDYSNWKYSDAPMNFLQIYDTDFIYASGLANCTVLQMEGRPASPGVAAKPPDVSSCAVQPTDSSYADVQATQQLLNLTSQKLLSIAEPVLSPAITTGGIVPGTIQPGEWVSIYGTNLASETATWTGNFPTSLGGTSVTIDGKPTYLSFVSYGQINLQAPNDNASGVVPVVITTASGTVKSTVTLAQFGPAFFLLDTTHVSGIILRSNGKGAYGGGAYDIIGPTGTSLGYATVAAKAGDNVALFGNGFGPTSPVVPAGQAYSGAAATTEPVTLRINNMSVTPAFAGLSGPGLYQINLTIPPGLGTGDVSLQAMVGGVQTPSGTVISLQ
jgi:uncharacterized protein (TIGR03437 family)